MLKTIQIYTNRINIDLSPFLDPMYSYYKDNEVIFNYDITRVDISGYQSVYGAIGAGGKGWYLTGVNLPPNDHDITMFIFDLNEWKAPWYWPFPLRIDAPRSSTMMENGKPLICLGLYDKDPEGTQMAFLHEPEHALAKIFGCVDQIDNYIKYNLKQYRDPDSSMSIQWAIFKPYLQGAVSPVATSYSKPGITQSTLDLIASFEGFSSTSYRDQGRVYTIGYGFTTLHGQPVTAQTPSITKDQAQLELKAKLQIYADQVNKTITVPITQNKFDACCSLCYNIGVGGFAQSTVAKECNAQDFTAAADAFLLWDKVKGQVSQGLLNRRQKERLLFLTN